MQNIIAEQEIVNTSRYLQQLHRMVNLVDCWIPPMYNLTHLICVGISLSKLDQALFGHDLNNILPLGLKQAVRKRQLSFLGGRLCAERALSLMGRQDDVIGRSYSGFPLWPTGVLGSITHHDEAAYAVVASAISYVTLGIDSERLVEPSTAESIQTMCCTELEKQSWLGGRTDTLVETLIFSAKEAGYKAIYHLVGHYIDFSEFEVSELNWPSGYLLLTPTKNSVFVGRIRAIPVYFHVENNCVYTLVAEHVYLACFPKKL